MQNMMAYIELEDFSSFRIDHLNFLRVQPVHSVLTSFFGILHSSLNSAKKCNLKSRTVCLKVC